MVGSIARLPAPPLPDGPRSALIVATNTYADSSFRALRAPSTDADELGRVLADADIGGFSVTKVVDKASHQIKVAIEDFLRARTANEFVLVYLSCHGVTDLRRRLHFAATDTDTERLASTGVASLWVTERLEECRARRQLLILDCCFSGAFAHGGKGAESPALDEFTDPGRGRITLTASNALEYSFEASTGEAKAESATPPGSFFTAALVKGLTTGTADTDGNGLITISEAFHYARREVRAAGASQTPQHWMAESEGEIPLARSPIGQVVEPAVVPEALRHALESPLPAVRIGAVEELSDWLSSNEVSKVLTAKDELARVAEEDIPRVATRARDALAREGHASPAPAPVTSSAPPPPPASPGTSAGAEVPPQTAPQAPPPAQPAPAQAATPAGHALIRPAAPQAKRTTMPPAITAKLDKPTVAGGPTTLRLKLGTEHAVVARPKFWNDTLEVDGIAVKRASYVEGFCSFPVTHGDESVVVALNVTRTTSGATYEYSFTDLSVGGKAVRIESADVLAPGQAPSTLTPTEVSNVRFTPVRLREGYDMVEVDKFLDLIEGELAARYVALANTAATSVPSFAFAGNDISEKRFTTVRLREGYDMGEVDRFLDRAEESVRTLDARLGIKE